MEIFLSLIAKILPLYLIIFLGFLAGKFLKAQKETIASILIYTITPVIVFHGVLTTEINLGILLLPVFYFALCSFLCLCSYFFTKKTCASRNEGKIKKRHPSVRQKTDDVV